MGLSNATFGLVGGFVVLPLPQMLAAQGVPELRIAAISAACLFPGFWAFLLGPLLDLRFSRRWYAAVFAVLAGVALGFAVMMRAHLLLLEAALITSYAAATLNSNALGGWLAGLVPEGDGATLFESRLSAWTQVGLFLGNGLMAGLAAECLRVLPLGLTAVLLGSLVALPALIFFWIPVPAREREQAKKLAASFGEFFREIGALLKKREVVLTSLLFIAPTGSFALTNMLGGVAADFHASDAFVSRMGGAVLSIAGAASCLLLPVLARRVKPLPLYLLIGTVGSLFTLLLLALPRTPGTFAVAFLGENVVQALSFTAAVAICFEVIGRNNPLAATQFGLLTAVTVVPILYMGKLDGRTYGLHWTGHASLQGMTMTMLIDGGLSLLACAVMLAVMRWLAGRTALGR
jgi:PAT family beta-lactamase induction signal transducer AmpG